MELDQQLCYCFHINKRKIVNFVKRERPKRASQISECFGAGTGCGWCVPFLKEIHRQIVAGEAIEPGSITAEEYEKMRGGYLKDIKAGTRRRNRHGGSEGSAGETPLSATDPLVTQDDLDYTRYFSSARHDPLPETIEAPSRRETKPSRDAEGSTSESSTSESSTSESRPSEPADAEDVGA